MLADHAEAPDRAQAEALAGQGRFLEAAELGAALNAQSRDPALERALVSWRRQAFFERQARQGAVADDVWPKACLNPFPELIGAIPEASVADLSAELLGGAIVHHGCLLVRGLMDQGTVQNLVHGIDCAVAAAQAQMNGDKAYHPTDGWYWPTHLPSDPQSERSLPLWRRLGGARKIMMQSHSVMLADSPRNFAQVVALLNRAGVKQIVGEYLGEAPAVSVKKSALRKVPPRDTPGDWHQDGAFLGADKVRTINLWVALSDCGERASGLDIIPRRFGHLAETATEGAYFHWSVGHAVAMREAGASGYVTPNFAAGDALFFDQWLLHRTSGRPGFTESRYALENWMFAPSMFPMEWLPVVL